VRVGFILSALFLLVAAIFGLTGPSANAPANRYVNSQSCAECHQKISESYRQTSMGRSFFAPAPENTIEDYKQKHTYDHAASDTHYSMDIQDGTYYQRRWQTGFDGKDTNREDMRIDYVVGAGDHARSYLHRTELGTLIELPLGWYSERDGYWAMSPGFDSHHPQTRRLVSYECMFCHNGYPQNPTESQAQNPVPVFSGTLPQGIDCQRCHGPGELHERTARTQGMKPAEIRATIVNPARLNPKLQLEACMQCHLEPTSGRIPSIMRKFDRSPYSFVPGQPLEDFTLYFDHPPGRGYDDKFEIAGAAYRLRKSRCFLESKGEMTCLTCHDPHQSLPTGDAGEKYFSARCLGCHQGALSTQVAAGKHPADSRCLTCHMPQRRTDDVVHAVVTDHFIQRQLPARDLLAELRERHLSDAEDYHGEVVPYYPLPLPPVGENPLYQAVAQVALGNNLKQGLSDLSRAMSKHPPREMEFYTTLGDAYRNSGETEHAAEAFEQAVQRSPDSVTALQSLAGAYKGLGKEERSEEALNRALRIAPSDASVWLQYGMLDAGVGRTDRAIEKVRKAVGINPDLPEAYTSLAGLLFATHQLDPAEVAVRNALSTDPYDATAYNTAGRVLATKGQAQEALFDFAKAARLRPTSGAYNYDYALMLVHTNQFDQAEVSAQAAVAQDPNFAPGHELLGTLFARKSQLAEAAGEYQKAVQIQPDFSRAQLDLGLILANQGDLAGAAEHLRAAAAGKDPAVAQRATQALARIGKQ
jgi:tetratricopeptide (TPR) repeat protein